MEKHTNVLTQPQRQHEKQTREGSTVFTEHSDRWHQGSQQRSWAGTPRGDRAFLPGGMSSQGFPASPQTS